MVLAAAGTLILCIILFSIVELTGKTMDPDVQTRLDNAGAAYSGGKFAEAETLYRQVNELDPGNPQALEPLGNIALLNNRAREAERYFLEARKAVPWYGNIWPLTSELNSRLSLAYYREDRFAEASAAMLAAAGPFPLGPLADAEGLGRQTALLAGLDAYEIEGPEESRINFVITDPLPVVAVAVNGGPQMNFIVDTGGAEIILDDDLAAEAGARMAGSLTGSFAGSKKAKMGLGVADSLAVGDFLVRNVPVQTIDTDPWASEFGMDIKGVVGTRFLMHFLSTIDYPGGCLILRRLTPGVLETFEAQIARNGAKVIPFWLADMHIIVAWGTVNGLEPMLFFVDTGLAGKGFTATESTLNRAGIPVDWTKADEGIGGAEGTVRSVDISIRRLTLGAGPNEVVGIDVPGSVMEGSIQTLQGVHGFQVGGLISHAFFRPYALTLDFTGMRLTVQ